MSKKSRKDYMRSGEGEFIIYDKDGNEMKPNDKEEKREEYIQEIMKYANDEINRKNKG